MTIRLLSRTHLRHLAKTIDFHPRASLGQHFIHDASTARQIAVSSHARRSDHVLEIGPGLGSLTLALLDRGASVIAVESDPVLAEQLPLTVADHSHSEIHRLTVLHQNPLTLQRSDLADDPTVLVASLPSQTAVAVLLHLLSEFPSIRTATVVVESQISERVTAEPKQHPDGVKMRFFGDLRRLTTVSPSAFWPIPRSYYSLLRLDRYQAPAWSPDPAFRAEVFGLADIAFAQRHKTARNAFAEWAGSGHESARLLLAASIDPARRPQSLGAADLARLQQRSGDTDPHAARRNGNVRERDLERDAVLSAADADAQPA